MANRRQISSKYRAKLQVLFNSKVFRSAPWIESELGQLSIYVGLFSPAARTASQGAAQVLAALRVQITEEAAEA